MDKFPSGRRWPYADAEGKVLSGDSLVCHEQHSQYCKQRQDAFEPFHFGPPQLYIERVCIFRNLI